MKLANIVTLIVVLFLGACSHTTSNTNQFYISQSYLPITDELLVSQDLEGGAAAVANQCRSGPVILNAVENDERVYTRVLQGMKISVLETSYSSLASNRKSTQNSWEWIVPSSEKCSEIQSSIPKWNRADLLKVRHLLSGAENPLNYKPVGSPNKQYFMEAVSEACNTSSEIESCLNSGFLEIFARGLFLDARMLGKGTEVYDSENPFGVPEGIRGEDLVLNGETTGLAFWYSDLNKLRIADLFVSGNPPLSETCSKNAVNKPACKFALRKLKWISQAGNESLPGKTLNEIQELDLISSGDPLLLMQPAVLTDAIDTEPGTLELEDLPASGFVNFEIMLPVTVEGAGADYVPIYWTIADYEKFSGRTVKSVKRSSDWLPKTILINAKKSDEVKTINIKGGSRFKITFTKPGGKSNGGDVSIASTNTNGSAKGDFLFAPGDILEVR